MQIWFFLQLIYIFGSRFVYKILMTILRYIYIYIYIYLTDCISSAISIGIFPDELKLVVDTYLVFSGKGFLTAKQITNQ